MAHELYYTSAPRGLRTHSSGFCTVGMTRGFPAPFIQRLEALSGYRPPAEDAGLESCPTAHSHWIVDAAGLERHVLSAVRQTAPDHTGRTNKIAHHLLLHASELVGAGPAWLITQRGVMEPSWVGEPRELPNERHLPASKPAAVSPCAYWKAVCGDAGWAGVLANSAMLDPSKPCSVVYQAGTDPMRLIAEAMALLPSDWRWRVTFTSYFMQPVAGLRCTWRFCLDGTEAAAAARASGGTVVDLALHAPCTRTGSFIDHARNGAVEDSPRAHAAEPAPTPRPPTSRPPQPAPSATPAGASAPAPPRHEPVVDTGVDYVEAETPASRVRDPLFILAVVAAILFLLTTIVFFALWQRSLASSPAAVAPAPAATTPPAAEPASRSAQAPAPVLPAEDTARKLEVANANLTGELLLANDRIAAQEAEIAALKERLGTNAIVSAAPAPTMPEPPAQAAPDDLGPTRASEWIPLEAPELARTVSGDWTGSRTWRFEGRRDVRGATWVTADETHGDGVAPRGNLLEAGRAPDRGAIARLDCTGDAVIFKWVATASQVAAIGLKGESVTRMIQDIPIRVEFTDGAPAWVNLGGIEVRELTARPYDITLRLPEEALHWSSEGGAWTALGDITTLPVALAGRAGTVPIEVGALRISRKGAGVTIHFRLEEDYDPRVREARVQEAEAAAESARRAESVARGEELPRARSMTRSAAEELETTKRARGDAARIMEGLPLWRALLVQRGSVPIEFSIKAPPAPKAPPRGGTT